MNKDWYHIRNMGEEDILQVMEIEGESFPSITPAVNYRRELNNGMAFYVVACAGGAPDELLAGSDVADSPAETGILSQSEGNARILGYAGIWMMYDEAHLVSIAVRRQMRSRGIGDRLLVAMIEKAMDLNAQVITLEVRLSNYEARQLYVKYGFEESGVRPHYYVDNREDALLMSVLLKDNGFREKFRELRRT